MKKTMVVLSTVAALLAGCNSVERQSAESYRGREETKKLEGASAVGYDGVAVRKSVDSTLNRNDDHNRELDQALLKSEKP